MLSPQALFKLVTARLLPTPNADSQQNDAAARGGRYGEAGVLSFIRKQHLLADEGSYFVAHNAQTGIVSSLLGTAFAQTTLSPFLIITNTDGANGKSIYLDYLNLICTVAGAAAAGLTNLLFAWSIDQSNARYSSGGTDITGAPAASGGILNPNSGVPKKNSVAQINAGALTLGAATAAARLIVAQRQLRQLNAATALGVAQDHLHMNFGGVEEVGSEVDISTAKTNALAKMFGIPPIVVAPGHCAILHLWSPGAALTTGITLLPELGYFER